MELLMRLSKYSNNAYFMPNCKKLFLLIYTFSFSFVSASNATEPINVVDWTISPDDRTASGYQWSAKLHNESNELRIAELIISATDKDRNNLQNSDSIYLPIAPEGQIETTGSFVLSRKTQRIFNQFNISIQSYAPDDKPLISFYNTKDISGKNIHLYIENYRVERGPGPDKEKWYNFFTLKNKSSDQKLAIVSRGASRIFVFLDPLGETNISYLRGPNEQFPRLLDNSLFLINELSAKFDLEEMENRLTSGHKAPFAIRLTANFFCDNQERPCKRLKLEWVALDSEGKTIKSFGPIHRTIEAGSEESVTIDISFSVHEWNRFATLIALEIPEELKATAASTSVAPKIGGISDNTTRRTMTVSKEVLAATRKDFEDCLSTALADSSLFTENRKKAKNACHTYSIAIKKLRNKKAKAISRAANAAKEAGEIEQEAYRKSIVTCYWNGERYVKEFEYGKKYQDAVQDKQNHLEKASETESDIKKYFETHWKDTNSAINPLQNEIIAYCKHKVDTTPLRGIVSPFYNLVCKNDKIVLAKTYSDSTSDLKEIYELNAMPYPYPPPSDGIGR